MTENEALEMIKSMSIQPNCEMLKAYDFQSTVIKALEDLGQYRAIGTIDEFKAYKNGNCMNHCEHYDNCANYIYSKGYNRSIDEFAERLKADTMAKTFGLRICDVDRIAEQMKGGGNSDN